MADLPRIICDRCMKDARVERAPKNICVVSCHDTEQILYESDLCGTNRETVRVWTAIEPAFWKPYFVAQQLQQHLKVALDCVELLAVHHRVHTMQGGKRLVVEAKQIDPLIDTLLLFRADPNEVQPEELSLQHPTKQKVCTCAAINPRDCACRVAE